MRKYLVVWVVIVLGAVAATSALAQGDDPSAWARAGWEAGKRSGTVWGYPDGTYHPRAYATREEAQTFAHAEASRQQPTAQPSSVNVPAQAPVPQGGRTVDQLAIFGMTVLGVAVVFACIGFIIWLSSRADVQRADAQAERDGRVGSGSVTRASNALTTAVPLDAITRGRLSGAPDGRVSWVIDWQDSNWVPPVQTPAATGAPAGAATAGGGRANNGGALPVPYRPLRGGQLSAAQTVANAAIQAAGQANATAQSVEAAVQAAAAALPAAAQNDQRVVDLVTAVSAAVAGGRTPSEIAFVAWSAAFVI